MCVEFHTHDIFVTFTGVIKLLFLKSSVFITSD